MKRTVVGLVAGLGALLLAGGAFLSRRPSASTGGVRPGLFQTTDFNAAQQEASAANKPMLLDFYADWCQPCKVMDRKVFTHPKVVQEARDFVTVKVNSAAQPAVIEQFKVNRYPTLIWTDSSGKELFRRVGALDASGFLKAMKQHRSN